MSVTGVESRHEEVTFRQRSVTLAGTVTLPEGPGPCPGLVMLQGSGPTSRDNLGDFPAIRDHFVTHGLAVLCYDKPGIGGSTGDWREQSYSDRADEALAALRYLQERTDIVSGQVGLWGLSQGGWIVPLAASRGDEVAFAIPVSGPGVSPAEQDAYATENQMRAAGFNEAAIAAVLTFIRSCIEAAQRGVPFNTIEPRMQAAKNEAWYDYFPFGDEKMWGFLQRNAGYDPAPALSGVRCPLYAIFGAADTLVPVDRSVEVVSRALIRTRSPDFVIRVFPGASHNLHVERGGQWVLAAHYLDSMTTWIWEHLG